MLINTCVFDTCVTLFNSTTSADTAVDFHENSKILQNWAKLANNLRVMP
jgi:hypothetical protein